MSGVRATWAVCAVLAIVGTAIVPTLAAGAAAFLEPNRRCEHPNPNPKCGPFAPFSSGAGEKEGSMRTAASTPADVDASGDTPMAPGGATMDPQNIGVLGLGVCKRKEMQPRCW